MYTPHTRLVKWMGKQSPALRYQPIDWKQCKPEYISLFEYLKRPAGTELGIQIRKTALVHGIEVKKRNVTTARYTGNVALYPKAWLDAWFRLYGSVNAKP